MFSALSRTYFPKMRSIRWLRVTGPLGIGSQISLIPLLANGETECTGHHKHGTYSVRVPMWHHSCPDREFYTIDIETGPSGISKQGHMLWCTRKPFVHNIFGQSNGARRRTLGIDGRPDDHKQNCQ